MWLHNDTQNAASLKMLVPVQHASEWLELYMNVVIDLGIIISFKAASCTLVRCSFKKKTGNPVSHLVRFK